MSLQGNPLTAVMIEAERAALADPTQAAATLGRVAGAVYDSLEELRRIARELRPEALDDLGLINALSPLSFACRPLLLLCASSGVGCG